MHLARLCCVAITLTTLPTSSAAIIHGFDPSRHERFLEDGSANPGFLVPESQLSGIAVGRGVLISPRHYVAAAHVSTPSVTFRGSDGLLRSYSSVASQTLQTNVAEEGNVASDIIVYTLGEDVDPAITPLPIAVGSIGSFPGQVFYAFDQFGRAGRNIIESVEQVEFTSGDGDSIAVRFSYDTFDNGGTGGVGADEIGLLGSDSGFQAIIRVGDQLGVIGTHMGIDVPAGNVAENGDRYDSYSTLLAAYESELQSIVSASGHQLNRLTITAIPEPQAWLTLGMFVALIRMRRGIRTRPNRLRKQSGNAPPGRTRDETKIASRT